MPADFPYQDPSLSIEERVEDLLGRMTLAEKAGQMLQLDARQDLAEIIVDRLAGSILHTSPAKLIEAGELVARTRLRIPLLTAEDCIHGHSFWPGATIFPTQLAMAATWDAPLVERVARATAVEASATGIHWTFSPVLCIARDLRWGRVDETFGEDPYLISELGAAMIRGYQGGGLTDPTAILATAKHFAGYSETQGGRDASEADISRRKLRSWFLPPFERAAKEGCAVFMLGYQSMDGVPITANKWLLNDVLKDEWGFTGTLVTDWDNVGRMVWEQKVCADYAEASARAVTAGNDVIMTTPAFFEGAQEAVARGLLGADDLDSAVRRILRLKFELGLFENPRTPDAERQRAVIGNPEHTELNLEVARRSLVLLRNDGVLPLDGSAGPRRIAVLGPNADDVSAQLGDWAGNSGQVDWMPDGHPRELTATVLDGLRAAAPAGWEVVHERGADIEHLVADPAGETFPDGQPRPPISQPIPADPERIAAAVAAARSADVAVVVVGDTVNLTGEHKSTATLELQGGQIALLDAVAATGTPMVVVLIDSKPHVLPPSALNASALIQAFNPGMRGGQALAELILGHIEPSGRMPISAARHVGQQPIYYNQLRGQHGTRYADLTQDPLFAFGEGLSYTTVVYDGLTIGEPDVTADGAVRASVRLTNTGTRPALETVQAYVSDLVTSVTWASRELKAYRQVTVPPGESMTVEIEVPASDCTLVDADAVRVVELGDFELLVGPNSRPSSLLSAKFRIS
ncbi:putative glycosyl hydrolase [Actinoplanes missouriensis 431]|uniref:beta-glucosidase n=1 Tax=Actinoplanes missouriensis (strain ATCC 14538 / DSM 43046 / CBS 188.64 / JCM 3121 / NBRC 102363 / NCIMB 12654 / NRRL B-3342 / UNCC 431) TaxID=512565 RepID=I0HEE6_ACTM4|nr:glycoside hydrolase family 3 N-terminal domain-containing protein [Actinoplanes missouriensis]BAL91383.1 putative glycosyl hydrolase [Actinoplanes missouriensis 431]